MSFVPYDRWCLIGTLDPVIIIVFHLVFDLFSTANNENKMWLVVNAIANVVL